MKQRSISLTVLVVNYILIAVKDSSIVVKYILTGERVETATPLCWGGVPASTWSVQVSGQQRAYIKVVVGSYRSGSQPEIFYYREMPSGNKQPLFSWVYSVRRAGVNTCSMYVPWLGL